MRTRARTMRQRRYQRSQRDADSLAPVSSTGANSRYREVPLPRFRREVVALLVAARQHPRLDSTAALRLVIRWDRMVRLRHAQGKPPCNVADHILKYESQKAVCPCGSPLQSARDKDRAPRRCHRCSRRGLGSRRDPGTVSKLHRYDTVFVITYRYQGSEDRHAVVARSDEGARKEFKQETWAQGARILSVEDTDESPSVYFETHRDPARRRQRGWR